jgi:hypothetical protein
VLLPGRDIFCARLSAFSSRNLASVCAGRVDLPFFRRFSLYLAAPVATGRLVDLQWLCHANKKAAPIYIWPQ